MKGILSTETDDTRLLLDKVRAYPGLVGRDLIPFVTFYGLLRHLRQSL
jgi:carbamoyl-phosphate synthase small subunit